MEINEITDRTIGAAIRVHRALGPGLLESAYKRCLGLELTKEGLRFQAEVPLPVVYDDTRLDAGYRLDLLIERRVVVEIKSVAALDPVHTAQVLTYLKLGGYPLGLLLNFNVRYLTRGAIRRLVLGYTGPKPNGR